MKVLNRRFRNSLIVDSGNQRSAKRLYGLAGFHLDLALWNIHSENALGASRQKYLAETFSKAAIEVPPDLIMRLVEYVHI